MRWLKRLNEHPRGRDALVASIWLAVGVSAIQFGIFPLWRTVALFSTDGTAFFALILAMAAVATQRSTRPMPALGVGTALAVVDLLFGGSIGVLLVFTDLIYSAFKYGSDRGVRVVLWSLAGAGVATVMALIVVRPRDVATVMIAVQWTLIVFIAAAWGWEVRSERVRTRTALARKHAQAMQQLRRRIAHDLHDLVANQIAVAGLHVEAAKLQYSQIGEASADVARSLDQAAQGTVQADRQLRRMIQVLNAIDDLDEQSDATVNELVDQFLDGLQRTVPAPRTLEWTGEARTELRALLADTEVTQVRTQLRVLSELLANAIKHGTGTIRIEVRPALHTITVTNEVPMQPVSRPGSGIGITGASLLLEETGACLDSQPEENGRIWRAALTTRQEER